MNEYRPQRQDLLNTVRKAMIAKITKFLGQFNNDKLPYEAPVKAVNVAAPVAVMFAAHLLRTRGLPLDTTCRSSVMPSMSAQPNDLSLADTSVDSVHFTMCQALLGDGNFPKPDVMRPARPESRQIVKSKGTRRLHK